MAETNSNWRVNRTGVKTCCYAKLQYEMYRRREAGEDLMRDGDMLTCETCHAEMICDKGTADRLRWRLMQA